MKESCLNRFNGMVATLLNLKKEGEIEAAAIMYYEASGFLTGLMYAEAITIDEYEGLNDGLFRIYCGSPA